MLLTMTLFPYLVGVHHIIYCKCPSVPITESHSKHAALKKKLVCCTLEFEESHRNVGTVHQIYVTLFEEKDVWGWCMWSLGVFCVITLKMAVLCWFVTKTLHHLFDWCAIFLELAKLSWCIDKNKFDNTFCFCVKNTVLLRNWYFTPHS